MPAETNHPCFSQPQDSEALIWRYMDLWKFTLLLSTRALWFSRADLLGDPFEGSCTATSLERRETELRDSAFHDDFVANLSAIYRGLRRWTFVSCWHLNDHESAAMWDKYAPSGGAIAIKSTYRQLAAILPDQTLLGLVQYLDYSRDEIPDGNLYAPYSYKRLSFKHESEVRAVRIPEHPMGVDGIDYGQQQSRRGESVPVDLSRLISGVVVSPTCPAWYLDVATTLVQKFGLAAPVSRSLLEADPVF